MTTLEQMALKPPRAILVHILDPWAVRVRPFQRNVRLEAERNGQSNENSVADEKLQV